MNIDKRLATVLRFVLVALFALLVLLQTLSLPGQFAHMAQENPDRAYLRWPLTGITVFWALCAQVVIVAALRLLSLAQADRIFTGTSRPWADAMTWAIAAGSASFAAVAGLAALGADDPGAVVLAALLTLALGAGALLMAVLRSLLLRATALRADLEAVI